MTTMKLVVLALIATMMFTLTGCNSKENDAARQARDRFAELRKSTNGLAAEKLAKEITSFNPDGGKSTSYWMSQVGYRKGELSEYVAKAYLEEFKADFADLKLAGKPHNAERLRTKLKTSQERAKAFGYNGPFPASETAINKEVIRVKEADLRNERARIYNGHPRVIKVRPTAADRHRQNVQRLANNHPQ